MNLFFFCDQKLIVWISFFKGCQQKIDGFGLGTVHRPYIAVYIFSIRDRWMRMEIKTAGDFFTASARSRASRGQTRENVCERFLF